MIIRQATCPNSKELFLITASSEDVIQSTFPASLYQVRQISYLLEEEEALADAGDSVASGEINSTEAIINVLRHRAKKVVNL